MTMMTVSKPDVLAALAVLAHPVRLDVFRALVQAGPEGVTPTALAAAGLVANARAGRNVLYRADYDRMDGVIGYLTENCCAGTACAVAPAAASCGC